MSTPNEAPKKTGNWPKDEFGRSEVIAQFWWVLPVLLAIVVAVQEVFLHCAKAFRRAGLWDPDQRQDRREMPSLVKMILDQTTGAPTDPSDQQQLDDKLEQDYRTSMY